MNQEIRIVLVIIVDKERWVVLILHEPAAPEIADAFLVSRRANDSNCMQIDSFFDDIDRRRRDAVCNIRVSTQEHRVQKIRRVFLFLDTSSPTVSIYQ